MLDLDHLREIWAALSANPARTLLTAFGVFWGLFLLVVLLGSGNGLENGVRQDFGGTATNSFYIWTSRTSKPYRGLQPGRPLALTDEDVAAVRATVPEAEVVAPRSQLGGFGGGHNVSRKTRSGGFSVMGDVPEVRLTEPMRIERGRFLNPLDVARRRKVAVIGPRVQEVLFAPGEEPVGQDIRINGVFFRVVGVFRPGSTGESAESDSQSVFVPFSTFQRAFQQGNRVGWLAITSRPDVLASVAEVKVLKLLKARHRVAPDDERAFGHYNVEEGYLRVVGLFAGIRTLVWIVGIGTLAAGVIGVSNIMLVIVRERTKEIGIRRAVGAAPGWITGQIVLEALLLTSAAGYLGLVAGVGTLDVVRALIAASGSPPQMFVNPDVALGSAGKALAVLVVCGVLAGLLPAQRALAIRTAEALRAD